LLAVVLQHEVVAAQVGAGGGRIGQDEGDQRPGRAGGAGGGPGGDAGLGGRGGLGARGTEQRAQEGALLVAAHLLDGGAAAGAQPGRQGHEQSGSQQRSGRHGSPLGGHHFPGSSSTMIRKPVRPSASCSRDIELLTLGGSGYRYFFEASPPSTLSR